MLLLRDILKKASISENGLDIIGVEEIKKELQLSGCKVKSDSVEDFLVKLKGEDLKIGIRKTINFTVNGEFIKIVLTLRDKEIKDGKIQEFKSEFLIKEVLMMNEFGEITTVIDFSEKFKEEPFEELPIFD